MNKRIFFAVSFFVCLVAAPAATIYVPLNYPIIQDAIDASAGGDTIVVSQGTYYENLDFSGKAIVLKSSSGPLVTIIDGGQAGSVVSFKNGEASDSEIRGFTITNGTGTNVGTPPNLSGGGILCGPASSPAIRGNIIRDNTCWNGGGIFNYGASSPIIANNFFTGNVCKNGGAVDNVEDSRPTISGNVMTGNSAPTYGGAIRCFDGCHALIENNLITDNQAASGRGGGIYCYYADPIIRRNRIIPLCQDSCRLKRFLSWGEPSGAEPLAKLSGARRSGGR